MTDDQRKKAVYSLLGILLLGILLLAGYGVKPIIFNSVISGVIVDYDDVQDDKTETLTNPDVFYALNTYKAGIKRIQIKNKLSVNDVKSYDFSAPGTSTYGDNPSFEIYNPLGGQLTYVSSQVGPSEYVEENSKKIFTIANNISGSDTNAPDLIVTITNVKEKYCKINSAYLANKSPQNRHYQIPHLKDGVNLLPYPKEAPQEKIVNLPSERGCFSTNDGFVYYQLLVAQ